MRLGVVLSGTGVYGAAGAGVLIELWRRKIEPCAVCAIGSGAWPSALFASGCNPAQMELACEQVQRAGKQLLRKARRGVSNGALALYTAKGLEQLLQVQTGGRLLALCPRRAIFPVRSPRLGMMAFSSGCSASGEGIALVTQASAAFAARAAMGFPPFLEPLEWMGAPVLPVRDRALAVSLLFSAGAQRVLIVEARPSPGMKKDGLLLAASCVDQGNDRAIPGTARLIVQMPERIGTLDFRETMACLELGKRAAVRDLDEALEQLGMAYCRVLPFRRS